MRKKVLLPLIGILLAVIAGGAYYYHKKTKPHYIITATEKALKNMGAVPSSMKVSEATFYTKDGKGTALIKYIYKNKFGADTDGYIILEYAAPPVENPSNGELAKYKYEAFKRDMENVKNGKLKIEPFSTMKYKSAVIDDRPLTEAENAILSSELLLQSLHYNGPTLGGIVTELNENGNHKYDFPVLEYKPNELFPYKRNR